MRFSFSGLRLFQLALIGCNVALVLLFALIAFTGGRGDPHWNAWGGVLVGTLLVVDRTCKRLPSPYVLMLVTFATAVLFAVLTPNFIRSCQRPSQLTACKSNLKNIGTACEMWSTDHSGRYPRTLFMLTPNYLKTIPTCPGAGIETYSSNFVSWSKPDNYTVYCQGSNHTAASSSPNYPQFNAVQGLIER